MYFSFAGTLYVYERREVNRFCRLDVLHIFLLQCNVLPSSHHSNTYNFFLLLLENNIKDPLNLIRVLQTCRLPSFSYLFSKEFGCCVIYIKFTYKVVSVMYSTPNVYIYMPCIFQFIYIFFRLLHFGICSISVSVLVIHLVTKNFELKKKIHNQTIHINNNITKSSKSQQTKQFFLVILYDRCICWNDFSFENDFMK